MQSNRAARGRRTGLATTCLLALGAPMGLGACAHRRPPEVAPEPEAQESSFRLFAPPDTGLPQAREARARTRPAPPARRTAGSQAYGDEGALGDTALPATTARPSVGERLSATTLTSFVVRDEESLRAVVDQLRQRTGLPLVVPPAVENTIRDAGVVFDFEFDNEVSARSLLDLISDASGGAVGWTIQHDAILFTTDPLRGQKLIVHAHDIHEIVMPRTDFKAPRIGRLRGLDELEDDDGGGAFGGAETVTRMDEAEVLALVQENVAPDTWDLDGVSIHAENGQLLVVHTVEIQLRVQELLEALR